MPEPGVPGAAFVRGVAPRDRMVHAHRAAVVAVLVDGRHHMHARPWIAAVVVQFVGDAPFAPVRGDAVVGEREPRVLQPRRMAFEPCPHQRLVPRPRSEEHTSELQSLMRISYAVFCLKKQIRKQIKKCNMYKIKYTIKVLDTKTKAKT